jgi:hypothetical protein
MCAICSPLAQLPPPSSAISRITIILSDPSPRQPLLGDVAAMGQSFAHFDQSSAIVSDAYRNCFAVAVHKVTRRQQRCPSAQLLTARPASPPRRSLPSSRNGQDEMCRNLRALHYTWTKNEDKAQGQAHFHHKLGRQCPAAGVSTHQYSYPDGPGWQPDR